MFLIQILKSNFQNGVHSKKKNGACCCCCCCCCCFDNYFQSSLGPRHTSNIFVMILWWKDRKKVPSFGLKCRGKFAYTITIYNIACVTKALMWIFVSNFLIFNFNKILWFRKLHSCIWFRDMFTVYQSRGIMFWLEKLQSENATTHPVLKTFWARP